MWAGPFFIFLLTGLDYAVRLSSLIGNLTYNLLAGGNPFPISNPAGGFFGKESTMITLALGISLYWIAKNKEADVGGALALFMFTFWLDFAMIMCICEKFDIV